MTTHTDLINATGVRVLIDLTDVSAYVKSETLMIKDTGGIEVETCTFAMRPLSPAVTLEWKDCQVIADLDDASSVYLFAGFVTRPVSAFADNGVETEIEVRAEGYKTLLARSKPFNDYYKGVTVEAMVESMLFDAELFDFTCNTQSEMVSYWDISIDESIAKNLDRFCKERNWAWRVGYNKSVTIGPESADVFGDWGIAEAQYVNMSTLYPVENIALESDASMIANAVMVIGGVATSDIVTEEFTGDGTTENFFLSARPIGSIISIMVDELYVSWGTIGYHSCAERDCLVHFESGYVRFCTPPLTGEVIRIQYNYQFPYTYTGYDSASQTLYGQTLWTLVEAPWINDDTAAAAYVAAIFEQAATAPKRTSCDVRRIGPRAGQSIACRFPSLGVGTPSVSETMLIESIGTTIDGRYPVQTLRLGPATERLLGTLETLLGGGTSSAKVASSSETSDHGLLTGLADDDHTQYLLATGTRTGASSQAQAFTNGIVGPTWKPASDSTTALQLQNATGASIVNIDTTNSNMLVTGKVIANGFVLSKTNQDMLISRHTGGEVVFRSQTTNGRSQIILSPNGNPTYSRARLLFGLTDMIADPVNLENMTFAARADTSEYWISTESLGTGVARPIVFKRYQQGLSPSTIDIMKLMPDGKVVIGTATPDSKLHIHLDDAATNAASQLLTLSHNTSGTVANGFGSRVLWELESSTTADQTAAALDVIWTEKTHATRTAKSALSSVRSGTLYELAAFSGAEGVVLNEAGESWADFRVEGDTATHLLFVDASVDAVGIGTSAPSSRFHVSQTTGDAGIREIARITHNSSGTPSKGFGVSLALALETTTTENMVAGLVAAIWNSATHASRAGDLIGYAADASGEREGWRVRASGSAPMLGLFGEKPILRPTTGYAAAGFTANSGTAVNDASTFDGYTIKQVVKALRDLGALT